MVTIKHPMLDKFGPRCEVYLLNAPEMPQTCGPDHGDQPRHDVAVKHHRRVDLILIPVLFYADGRNRLHHRPFETGVRTMERTATLKKTAPTRRERLAALVQERLARRGITKPVMADDDLRDSGISSLDMVNLMLAVEAEFALTIPEADMTPANFRSIAAIEVLIETLGDA